MILEKIGIQFKRPSGFLGKIVSGLMVKGNRSAYDILLSDLNIQPNNKILEIGYGPGIGINLLLQRFDSINITGIDFSELMFKKATKRNQQYIDKNKVDLLFGDFLEIAINQKEYDRIFCINVVYFWNNLQNPFEKICSLLKDGGEFHFYMARGEDLRKMKFTKDSIFNKYSLEQVKEVLQLVGFKKVESHFEKGYFIKAIK
jgi:cyclopropane fatty-acyl-phospholipid synthase-like methyltransferase